MFTINLTKKQILFQQAGHIINFEFPKFMADYIHRCGRTGRVGSQMTGHVTSFVHRPQEVELLQKIEVKEKDCMFVCICVCMLYTDVKRKKRKKKLIIS